jgi:hypothetical protein
MPVYQVADVRRTSFTIRADSEDQARDFYQFELDGRAVDKFEEGHIEIAEWPEPGATPDLDVQTAPKRPEVPEPWKLSDHQRDHIGDILLGDESSFNAQLLRLIAKADAHNRERIRLAFPDIVRDYETWYAKPL